MANTRDGLGRQTPVILHPKDREIIKYMKEDFGFGNQSAVVRFALRLLDVIASHVTKKHIVKMITFVMGEAKESKDKQGGK